MLPVVLSMSSVYYLSFFLNYCISCLTSPCSVAFPSSHGVLATFNRVIASVSLLHTHIQAHTHTVCDVCPLCSNSPCVINPCNYIVVFFPKALIKLCNVLDLPTLRKRLRKEVKTSVWFDAYVQMNVWRWTRQYISLSWVSVSVSAHLCVFVRTRQSLWERRGDIAGSEWRW